MYSIKERINQTLVVLILASAFFYFGFLMGEYSKVSENPCQPVLLVHPKKQREQIKVKPYTPISPSENIY